EWGDRAGRRCARLTVELGVDIGGSEIAILYERADERGQVLVPQCIEDLGDDGIREGDDREVLVGCLVHIAAAAVDPYIRRRAGGRRCAEPADRRAREQAQGWHWSVGLLSIAARRERCAVRIAARAGSAVRIERLEARARRARRLNDRDLCR